MLVNEVLSTISKNLVKSVIKKADDASDVGKTTVSKTVAHPEVTDKSVKAVLKRIPLLNKKGEEEVRKTVGDELYDEQWTVYAAQEVVSLIRDGIRRKAFRVIAKDPEKIKQLPPHEKDLFDKWLKQEPMRQKQHQQYFDKLKQKN